MSAITNAQMKRLQTLYGQLARNGGEPQTRESRIAWASSYVGRIIASFSDLTQTEASRMIDDMQRSTGKRAPSKRKRLSKRDAEKFGTEGRHDQLHNEATLVDAAALQRIQEMLDRIGWNQAQFNGWLRSPRSPIKRADPQVRTLGEANRVWWGLKHIAVSKGLWKDEKEFRRSA
jgi:hypothetical protein